MFISFEGIDGCGKTTQLRLLKTYLESAGKTVIATREPGGTTLAEGLRETLLHAKSEIEIAPAAELLLFGAARAQHVAQIIRPALARGEWVLCDRFGDSSVAYQGGGLGLNFDFIRQMNEFATQNLAPNRTFFLDLAPEIAFERRKSQSEDRIEARGLEFQKKVRDGYFQIAALEPERFVMLDATKSAAEIHARIVENLRAM